MEPEALIGVWRSCLQHSAGADLKEDQVVVSMRRIADVWKQLFPAEQQRIAQLLIERVDFKDGSLDIHWREDGWIGLDPSIVAHPLCGRGQRVCRGGDGMTNEAYQGNPRLRNVRIEVVGTRGSEGAKLDVSKLPGGLVLKPTQTMKGRGVVSGRIVLGGSMRPGNSVDVLTVDGRELEDFGTNREVLRVQAGARLETEFSLYGLDGELAGVEPVDKLVVIGGARFEGGKAGVVEVKPYIGAGVDRSKGIGLLDMRERTLDIMESTDAFVSGESFAGVVSSMPLLDVRLETVNGLDGGRVALTMQIS